MTKKLEDVRGVPALSSSYSVCEIHATSTRSSTQHGTERTTSNDLGAATDSDEGRAEDDERDKIKVMNYASSTISSQTVSHQSSHSQSIHSLAALCQTSCCGRSLCEPPGWPLLPPTFPPSFDTSLCPPSPSPFPHLLCVKTAAAAAGHLCSAFRIPPSDRPVSRFRSWPTSDPQCHHTPQSIQTVLSMSSLSSPSSLSPSTLPRSHVPCPGHLTQSIGALLGHTCTPNRHSKLVPAALIEIHQFSH